MATLTMLKGLSGSGKSTLAQKMTENGHTFRVNRDSLRPMLSNFGHSSMREKITLQAEKAIVSEVLRLKYCVVVDDTNLTPFHEKEWSNLASIFNAKFVVQEVFLPLEECVKRDKERKSAERVGGAVIHRQSIKSGMYNLSTEPGSIVVCDLDGTICDCYHRKHYLENKEDRKRWVKFFNECDQDEPIWNVIEWLEAFKENGKKIVLSSARDGKLCFDKTVDWLYRYNVPYDRILMRNSNDGRPDTMVKQDIINDLLLHHPKESIFTWIDDRKSVRDLVKSNGIPLLPVGDDVEF